MTMGYLDFDAGIGRKAKAVQDAAREFGMEVMRPAGIELDKLSDPADAIAKGSRLWDVFRQFREQGFHKKLIARAYGGTLGKAPPVALALMNEQLGYADAGLAISLEVSNMPFAFAMISEDPKVRDWARQYANDKEANLVGCWAITEPDHGTDWIMGVTSEGSNPKTAPSFTAEKKGDEYILNGVKSAWVSNGTIATHAVLHVGLDQSKGMHGSGLAMCPLDLPGITKGKPLDKIGQRPLNQGEIYFEDVQIPKSYMLLSVPGVFGGNLFGRTFLGGANSQMGVTFSGLARAVLDESIKYAKEHSTNGVPLFEQQNIRLKLLHRVVGFSRSGGSNLISGLVTAMFTSSRANFWFAGKAVQQMIRLYDKYRDNEKAMARLQRFSRPGRQNPLADWGKYGIASKVLATETAFRNASQAIQIFGELGASADYPVEKMFRDARASLIEDGANESLALAASESL